MAGAAMRELYDSAAKERTSEAVAKANKGRKQKNPIPAKVPELGTELVASEPVKPVPKKSNDTRDQVGKLVGVSGRYIDDATKQKQGSTRYPGNCRDTSNHRRFFSLACRQ